MSNELFGKLSFSYFVRNIQLQLQFECLTIWGLNSLLTYSITLYFFKKKYLQNRRPSVYLPTREYPSEQSKSLPAFVIPAYHPWKVVTVYVQRQFVYFIFLTS